MLPGKCINIEKTFVATGVINVCDDFTILVLPLVWVWKLHTNEEESWDLLSLCSRIVVSLIVYDSLANHC